MAAKVTFTKKRESWAGKGTVREAIQHLNVIKEKEGIMGGKFASIALVAACAVRGLAGDVPVGYTQIPWIESDGNQWIVTDYRLTVSDTKKRVDEKVEAKVRLTTINHTDAVFGAYGAALGNSKDGGSFAVQFFSNQRTTGDIWGYAGGWQVKSSGTFAISVDGEDRVIALDGNANKLWLDGVSIDMTQGNPGYVEPSPLCVFGGKLPGSGVSPDVLPDDAYKSSFRLYYLKVYNSSGDVVFNAVPVRDDNATVHAKRFGLYDLIGNRFYPNSGSRQFLVPEGYDSEWTHTLNHDGMTDAEAGAALVDLVANVADSGDAVKVGPGTYQLSEATGPVVISKKLKIFAADSDCSKTIIDANYATNCVTVTGDSGTALASIAGFTLKRGVGVTYREGQLTGGGGVFSMAGAGLTVSNCAIRACRLVSYYDPTISVRQSISGCGAAVFAKGNINLFDVRAEENVIDHIDAKGNANARFYPRSAGFYLMDGGTVERCIVQSNRIDISSTVFHSYSTFYPDGIYLGGETQPKIVRDTVIAYNRITNVIAQVEYGPGNGGKSAEGALYLTGGSALIERCLVKGNRNGSVAGFRLEAPCEVRDCTFEENASFAANSSGTSLHIGPASAGSDLPSGRITVSGCVFDGNMLQNSGDVVVNASATLVSRSVFRNEAGTGPMCFSLQSQYFTNSLCVFTDCENMYAVYYHAAGAECRGNLIDHCWFKNYKASSDYRGMADVRSGYSAQDVGCRFEFRNTLFEDSELSTLFYGAAIYGTKCEQFRCDACSFIGCTFKPSCLCKATSMVSKIDGVAWQELVGIHNTLFCNSKGADGSSSPFNTRWGTDYADSIKNCALDANDVVMAAETSNLVNIGNPRFRDPENGNYSPKASSPLRNNGEKSDWMDDATDLGEGFEYETGAYTIRPCGETYSVGATVAVKKPHNRVIGDNPDIGACEYLPSCGLMLLLK